MNNWLSLLLVFAAGVMIAIQGTVNASLGRSVGLPMFAAIFSLVQLICCIPGLLLWGWPLRLNDVVQTPWWQYIGAMLGVLVLSSMAFGFQRLGPFVGLVGLLVGQLSMGLVIDQFGLLGAPVQHLSLTRVIGICFLFAGVWLVKK